MLMDMDKRQVDIKTRHDHSVRRKVLRLEEMRLTHRKVSALKDRKKDITYIPSGKKFFVVILLEQEFSYIKDHYNANYKKSKFFNLGEILSRHWPTQVTISDSHC